MKENNPIVFISYSQDSLTFADRILKFSNKFRSEGIDVLTLDKANWRGTGRYRNQD